MAVILQSARVWVSPPDGSRDDEEEIVGTADTYQKFREFYDAAHAPGALDKKTKELIHLVVALALGCEP
ncbi:MAG: carboxymuconolactone decarboxylase family protein [Chloroflexota bacterium]|nr:carboxymuconolactone decarboxylase family protein [Chloroflexota bacterium]